VTLDRFVGKIFFRSGPKFWSVEGKEEVGCLFALEEDQKNTLLFSLPSLPNLKRVANINCMYLGSTQAQKKQLKLKLISPSFGQPLKLKTAAISPTASYLPLATFLSNSSPTKCCHAQRNSR
jgi:hypothetical protein